MNLQSTTWACLILIVISLPILAREEESHPENPEATRELFYALAQDGSPEAYALFEEIMTNPDEVSLLYAGFGDGRRGFQLISQAMNLIGEREDEASYALLVRLINDPVTGREPNRYLVIMENLLRFRDSHAEEILDIIEGHIFLPQSEIDRIRSEYPFVDEPGVTVERYGVYRDKDGEIIHRSRLFSLKGDYRPAVRGLPVIDTPRSWEILARYLKSYSGMETSSAILLTSVRLRDYRYRPEAITIYETVAMNERIDKGTRAIAIADFFDEVRRFHDSNERSNFQPLSEASEEALLRILDFANYALSLDFLEGELAPEPNPAFLPKETIDLIYQKRLEAIQHLEALGYDPEWLRSPDPKAPPVEEVSLNSVPETESAGEELVIFTDNPSSPVQEASAQFIMDKPARSFPWLSGLVGLGAALLFVYFISRRKPQAPL